MAVMQIHIIDNEIAALHFGDGLFAQLGEPELGPVRRQEQDHVVAEHQPRLKDGAVHRSDDVMLLEPEGPAQPIDRGSQIAISQDRRKSSRAN